MKIRVKKKLRFLSKNNKTGDSIGITLPKEIMLHNKKLEDYVGVIFDISVSGDSIILKSGCALEPMNETEFDNVFVKETKVEI